MAMGQPKTIYLSLGSNVGDRAANIGGAMVALEESGVNVVKQSSLYATEPLDFSPQHWFLNSCLEAETELMPRQLLHTLREIERSMGSRKFVRRGPRVIDLDILFYGAAGICTPELTVPHPRMTERRFVLVPLCEIAPALSHPQLNRNVAELLAECRDPSRVRRWHPQHP